MTSERDLLDYVVSFGMVTLLIETVGFASTFGVAGMALFMWLMGIRAAQRDERRKGDA